MELIINFMPKDQINSYRQFRIRQHFRNFKLKIINCILLNLRKK
jgi:hypothetical protein